MNRTLVIRLCLAAALVVSAAMTAPRVVKKHGWAIARDEEATVLVAERYIPAFTPLKPDLVRRVSMPKAFLPPGAIESPEELTNEEGQALFVAAIAIPERQPITRTLITGAGDTGTLARWIRPGRVAVSFEVDRPHGVGGWIKPGDDVAIFRANPVLRDAGGRLTALLFASVPVLAVDDLRVGAKAEKPAPEEEISAAPPVPEARVLTVLVNPNEAAQLIEARERGGLSVVLRALGDDLPWPNP